MMWTLPLDDHPEPLAATLGVMLYPGEDDVSQKRARAYAARFLAEPLGLFHEAGGSLAYEDLLRIATDGAGQLDDLDDRLWGGTATGEMFKVFFALAHTDPSLASWGNATRLAQVIAAHHRVPGSRASLYAVRRRFGSVAHLWAALCIREMRFQSDLDRTDSSIDSDESRCAVSGSGMEALVGSAQAHPEVSCETGPRRRDPGSTSSGWREPEL